MPDLDMVFPEGSPFSKWKWLISEEDEDNEEPSEEEEELIKKKQSN
jgi:hypothetical protein